MNLANTQVIVFRNGGKTSKSERSTYKSNTVKIVTYYRYLGLIFSSRNTWSKALSASAGQAEKALSSILKMIWKLGHPNITVAFNIFDSRVAPILFYGAEIWGSERRNQVEKNTLTVSANFVPGVGQNAHSAAVLGERGRLPLSIQYQKRYIKYWLKLIKMPENLSLNICYKMQVSFENTYRKGWITDLIQLLFSNGFEHVWILQGVGNEELFLKAMVLRMTDIAKQTWSNEITRSSKLSSKEFKTLLNPEKYLQVVNNYFIRRQLIRFRISNYQLLIEKGRHRGIDPINVQIL